MRRSRKAGSTLAVLHVHEAHFLKPPGHLGTRAKVDEVRGSGELVELVCLLYRCAVRLLGADLVFEMPHDICDLDMAAGLEHAKGRSVGGRARTGYT